MVLEPTRPEDAHAECREVLARLHEISRELEARPPNIFFQAFPFLLVPLILGSAALAAHLPFPSALLLVLMGAVAQVWIGLVGHDCTHGAYSPDPRWNRWVGTLCYAHSYVGFEAYRALHIAHHQHTGFDDDPSGDSPRYQGQTNLLSHICFVLIPLGFPIFQMIPGWLVGLDLAPKTYPKCVRARVRVDFLFVFSLHLGYWMLLGTRGYGMYFLSHFLGLFLVLQLLGFNHVGCEAYTDCALCNTRNIGSSRLVEILTFQCGYHVEHHILPKVPWYRLKELHGMLEELGRSPYSEAGFLAAHYKVIRAHALAALGRGPAPSLPD